MNFPTILYRCPGPHFAHAGQTYDYTQAASEECFDRLVSQGWHESLSAAVDAVTAVTGVGGVGSAPIADADDDNQPPTREELETMATDLGIKFDGRTGDAALLRKIEEAVAEKG